MPEEWSLGFGIVSNKKKRQKTSSSQEYLCFNSVNRCEMCGCGVLLIIKGRLLKVNDSKLKLKCTSHMFRVITTSNRYVLNSKH